MRACRPTSTTKSNRFGHHSQVWPTRSSVPVYSRAADSKLSKCIAAGKPLYLEVGMAKFSISEIAVIASTNEPLASHLVGQECEIISLPQPLHWRFSDGELILPGHYVVQVGSITVQTPEHRLRKRPQPGDYKSTLIPCDRQFPAVLDRWLNPAPATLEARMQRVFPSVGEINRGRG